MIGLDTNVLVRYVVGDDKKQAQIASSYIKEYASNNVDLLINNIVLCELIWVLESAYNYDKNLIVGVLERILQTSGFVVEKPDEVWQAVMLYKNNKADFSDALIGIINKESDCVLTITFDKKAGKLKEFELI